MLEPSSTRSVGSTQNVTDVAPVRSPAQEDEACATKKQREGEELGVHAFLLTHTLAHHEALGVCSLVHCHESSSIFPLLFVEFLGGLQEDMLLLKEDGAAAGAEAMEVEGDDKTKEPKVILLSLM
jgi:hypothetical protein